MREVCWVQNVLDKIGVKRDEPTEIHQDNLGSISWTAHVQGLLIVKQVEVKYHYVQDSVDKKYVAVTYTPLAENLGDSFIKVLIGKPFERLRTPINVNSISDGP